MTAITKTEQLKKRGKKEGKKTTQKEEEIKNMISGSDSFASGFCHIPKYHGFVFLVFNTLQQKPRSHFFLYSSNRRIINNNNDKDVNIHCYSDRCLLRVTVMPQCLPRSGSDNPFAHACYIEIWGGGSSAKGLPTFLDAHPLNTFLPTPSLHMASIEVQMA